jgi:hypothetical protein
MLKRKGYNREVIVFQIDKCRKLIKLNNVRLTNWIKNDFDSVESWPVCHRRQNTIQSSRVIKCIGDEQFKNCLAVNSNGKECHKQNWFKDILALKIDGEKLNKKINLNIARKALETYKSYWENILKEKFISVK